MGYGYPLPGRRDLVIKERAPGSSLDPSPNPAAT
jgi:hypothetical protein